MNVHVVRMVASLGLMASVLLSTACGVAMRRAVDDTVITKGVRASLLNDPELEGTRIKVTTSKGMVTISGSVPSEEVRNRILEIVVGTMGVRGLRSTLFIESASPKDVAQVPCGSLAPTQLATVLAGQAVVDSSATSADTDGSLYEMVQSLPLLGLPSMS